MSPESGLSPDRICLGGGLRFSGSRIRIIQATKSFRFHHKTEKQPVKFIPRTQQDCETARTKVSVCSKYTLSTRWCTFCRCSRRIWFAVRPSIPSFLTASIRALAASACLVLRWSCSKRTSRSFSRSASSWLRSFTSDRYFPVAHDSLRLCSLRVRCWYLNNNQDCRPKLIIIPQGKPTCTNRRTVHRTKLPYDKSNLRE